MSTNETVDDVTEYHHTSYTYGEWGGKEFRVAWNFLDYGVLSDVQANKRIPDHILLEHIRQAYKWYGKHGHLSELSPEVIADLEQTFANITAPSLPPSIIQKGLSNYAHSSLYKWSR